MIGLLTVMFIPSPIWKIGNSKNERFTENKFIIDVFNLCIPLKLHEFLEFYDGFVTFVCYYHHILVFVAKIF